MITDHETEGSLPLYDKAKAAGLTDAFVAAARATMAV
jgi:hypothetical protein